MKVNWRESLIVGVVLFVGYLIPGAYLVLIRNYVPGDALSRLVNAWLVFHGTEIKLASIGFIWPPIPTLMILPWTLIPALFQTWLAVVIVSALALALAGVAVTHLAAALEIPLLWRIPIVILFAINPLMILFGINGMSEAILVMLTLAACYWLVRLWQTNRNTYLIFAAASFGLLPLVRYEFAILSLWSGMLMLLMCWERRHEFSQEKFGQLLEGRLLAYSSLVIYPVFLWSVFNWFIMGSPFYFLFNERAATNLAEFQLSGFGIVTTLGNSFKIVFGIWFWAFPLELIATLGLVLFGWTKRSSFMVGMGLMPLVIPLLQFILLARRANVPLLRYFVMDVPLGIITGLLLVYFLNTEYGIFNRHKYISYAALCLLMLGSNFSTLRQINTYPFQTVEIATWRALTSDGEARIPQVTQAYEIGKILSNTIPAGSRVLVDTYGYGYAILLGAEDHSIFLDFTDPDFDQALVDPPAYADYVLLPNPTGRDVYYAVNEYQKTLYEEGATWAELVDILPSTIDGWKLYKIKR